MMLALSLVAFTACDTDRDDNPVLGPGNMPTEFVLNESPLSNQFIYISKDNNLKLSWSQPNYPINTVVNYMVQVGLVQGGSIKWNEEGGQPQFLETSVTTCTATLSGEEISQAINHNDGITDENNWVDPGYREIAFRVCANIQTTTKVEVEGTRIFSNAVTFKKMRPDNSVKGLASLYVIGNCSGWTEPAKGNAEALAAWRIMETEIGSKIFHGVIDMPDYSGDALTFRFYTKGAEPLETQGPLYMLTTSGGVNEKASAEMIQRAVAVAQRADVVVFLGGTDYSKPDDHATGTESHDRFIITLPGNQEELLKAIYEVNKNVVLVLESNSSLDITWAKENVPAIMAAWYGGQAQGQAICDVLFGDVNPSGKLTSTWYNNLGELPSESDSKYKNNGMLEYDIDQWGYTYMYYGRGTGGNVARQAEKPMYPFGYGLSYTTFEYGNDNGNDNVNGNGNDDSSLFTLSFSLKNTGTRKGAEVVQVYASFPGSSVSHRPTRKLVGFERVELEPGETKTVTIPVREQELAYYDEATHTWQVEGGTVKLSIGSSSDDERLSTTITTTAHKLADTYLSNSGTGINNVNGNDNVNGNNVQSSTIYDLNGTAVGTANDLQSLPKGIYILNGQKQTN